MRSAICRETAAVFDAAIPVTYLSHITGHGLLKIMRPMKPLGYRLTKLPPVPEALRLYTFPLGPTRSTLRSPM